MDKYQAQLLVGPTGSGKTPLGDYLEQQGLDGQRCCHFDFGANLRKIAQEAQPTPPISQEDIGFIKQVLATGILLENNRFHIAQNILRSFIREHSLSTRDLVVLNGLPRHVDQARDLTALLQVRQVVMLEAPAAVVHQRIQQNTGGDRAGRNDDSLPEIRRKLDIFQERTCPLVDYYKARQVPIVSVVVTATQTPDQVVGML